MKSAAVSFAAACLVSGVVTPLVRQLAAKARLVEDADGDLKRHHRAVPRLGGVAIAAGFFAPLLAVFALGAGVTETFDLESARMPAFLGGAGAIFMLGLWDDLRGLGATAKLSAQIMVALITWAAGFRIEVLNVPFFGAVDLGASGLIITVLWIVGLTNALNLVDGMDGLAAGVALFASGSLVVVGVLHDNPQLVLLAAAVAGSVLGFLPHNWPPARMFMGDSGSLFLGYVLAVASLHGATNKATTAVALLGPILILGLPILDTTAAVIRRTRRGHPIFDGDREHLHHRLLGLGLSPRGSVLLLYGLCAAFGLAGLLVIAATNWTAVVAVVALLAILLVLEIRLGFLRGRGAEDGLAHPLVEATRELVSEMAQASSPDSAWTALRARAPAVGIVGLVLVDASGEILHEWRATPERTSAREGRVVFDLAAGEPLTRLAGCRLIVEKRPIRRGAAVADEMLALLLEREFGVRQPRGQGVRPTSVASALSADDDG